MPLYEYRCSKCEKVFEVMQKFADTPLTVHEGCGGTVERILSAPAFQFKGSGWYATDYAKGGAEKKADKAGNGASDSKESKPAETKSESKTESKPAPAAASKKD